MTIITKYIFKKCLFNTFTMLIAFVMLFSLFNILGQIGDMGKGEYNASAMLIYTALQIPNFMYLLMPLGILIGVMMAMLGLVNYSEFAIIRTSGVSLRKIMIILLCYGAIFSIITFMLGELVAPATDSYAQIYKKTKTHELVSNSLHSGVWYRDGNNTFINIKQIQPDSTITGVTIFEYDNNLRLQQIAIAKDGVFDQDKKIWILHNITTDDYTKQNITRTVINTYQWKTSIEPKYFRILVVEPEDMSALGLLKYIHHLKTNNQSIKRYQIAFWSKLFYPISCITMSLVALAFIPNNRRNINLGGKLFAGILIGVSFFFSTRLIGFMAFIFNWNPIISATFPTAVLFSAGWYFVLRKE